MLQKSICLIVFAVLSLSSVFGTQSDFITYEWLIRCAENTSYTDHIPHFRRLFNTKKVRGFLECGCGYSTKYFLDHCAKVVSIEFMAPGVSDRWFQECLNLYRDCSHWLPLAYNADHTDYSFNNACLYACTEHKDYSLIDSSYLHRLNLYFKQQIAIAHQEGNEIEVAFVDAGVYTRGDMVKVLLANQVPIVVAHDTRCDSSLEGNIDYYGWFIVKAPDDYEKIYIPWGQGTTFWIHKSLPHVIQSIAVYRDKIAHEAPSFERVTELADSF